MSTSVTINYYRKALLWFGSLCENDKKRYPEVKGLLLAEKSLDNLIKKAPTVLNELLKVQGLPSRSWNITYKNTKSE